MSHAIATEKNKQDFSSSVSIDVDPQDLINEKLIESWVDREISYDDLMLNFPYKRVYTIRRLFKLIRNILIHS